MIFKKALINRIQLNNLNQIKDIKKLQSSSKNQVISNDLLNVLNNKIMYTTPNLKLINNNSLEVFATSTTFRINHKGNMNSFILGNNQIPIKIKIKKTGHIIQLEMVMASTKLHMPNKKIKLIIIKDHRIWPNLKLYKTDIDKLRITSLNLLIMINI